MAEKGKTLGEIAVELRSNKKPPPYTHRQLLRQMHDTLRQPYAHALEAGVPRADLIPVGIYSPVFAGSVFLAILRIDDVFAKFKEAARGLTWTEQDFAITRADLAKYHAEDLVALVTAILMADGDLESKVWTVAGTAGGGGGGKKKRAPREKSPAPEVGLWA